VCLTGALGNAVVTANLQLLQGTFAAWSTEIAWRRRWRAEQGRFFMRRPVMGGVRVTLTTGHYFFSNPYAPHDWAPHEKPALLGSPSTPLHSPAKRLAYGVMRRPVMGGVRVTLTTGHYFFSTSRNSFSSTR
jgi:hypothetical protein